jgi:hypothetical protein
MTGRPSDYTTEIALRVCEEVIGGKTIRQICSEDWAPAWSTMQGWLSRYEDFATQYARAREISADHFEAELIEEARSSTPETAAADRLRVDTLKWVAARRAPKKYGEKVTQELSGPDGGPIPTSLEVSFVRPSEAAKTED